MMAGICPPLSASTERDIFSLDRIRGTLIRLEDTIIFCLIERAQFAHNASMYDPHAFRDVLHHDGFEGSWLDWFLRETETMHAKVRRFESPDEHPFTSLKLLPPPILPAIQYPATLHPNAINVNDRILRFYIDSIIPAITRRASTRTQNDDENYGSAATRDVETLGAISRRVHYGMFVAESKFRSDPAACIPHIQTPNPQALLDLITKPAVEAALLVRLARKAAMYGQDVDANGHPVIAAGAASLKVDVDEVVRLYRDYIIPLTKDVEVDYLLHRLDGLSEAEIAGLRQTEST